jgi:hypothetical protein
MFFFLPRGEKLVWRIFFFHFISRIFYRHSFSPIGLQKNKHCLWLVGPKDISPSTIVIFSTDAVTDTLKYLAADKYYQPNRLGQCQNVLNTLKTFLLFS